MDFSKNLGKNFLSDFQLFGVFKHGDSIELILLACSERNFIFFDITVLSQIVPALCCFLFI